jgi:hypothetical protein
MGTTNIADTRAAYGRLEVGRCRFTVSKPVLKLESAYVLGA